MHDRFFSVRRVALISVVLMATCSTPKDAAPTLDSAQGPRAAAGAAPGAPSCPATGLWAKCSVLYRLERAGIAPHLDSTGSVEEKLLKGRETFVVKFGLNSRLEVFLYADS